MGEIIIIWPDLSIRLGKTIVLGRLNFVNDFYEDFIVEMTFDLQGF